MIELKSLTEPVKYIWSGDPAIDWEGDRTSDDFKEVFQKYVKSGDESVLPLIKDAKPTRFTLKRLSRRAHQLVLQHHRVGDLEEAFQDAAAYGVINWENLIVDGAELQKKTKKGLAGESRLADEILDLFFQINPFLITELGSRIVGLSTPDPLS